MTQFLDHLANDVMPALIDRLAAGAPKIGCGTVKGCLRFVRNASHGAAVSPTVRPDGGDSDFHSKDRTLTEQGTIRSCECRSFSSKHPSLSIRRLFPQE